MDMSLGFALEGTIRNISFLPKLIVLYNVLFH